MKKQSQHHPRFPRTLLSFQHLEGGSYGTFELLALDPNTLEIRLGNDFVRVNADGASQIAEASAHFAGLPSVVGLEIEEDDTEVVEVVETEEPRLARPRRAPRRRAGA